MENSTPPEDSPRQGSKVGTTAPEPPAAPQSGWADGLLAEHPSPHGQPEPPADTSERSDAHRWWTPIPSFEELTTEPQEPGLLARSDGRTLIYANELVTLYGTARLRQVMGGANDRRRRSPTRRAGYLVGLGVQPKNDGAAPARHRRP